MKAYVNVCPLLAWLFVGVLSEYPKAFPSFQLNASYRKSVSDRRATTNSSVLRNTARVFCMIVIDPRYNNPSLAKNFLHIEETWAPKCNHFLFFEPNSVHTQGAGYDPQRSEHLLQTEFQSYIQDFVNHENFDVMDWIVLGGGYTYFVMENLRQFLAPYNPSEKIVFGLICHATLTENPIYATSGSVFSREAFRALVNINTTEDCKKSTSSLGFSAACYDVAGVSVLDSRDNLERHRFTFNPPGVHIKADKVSESEWFTGHSLYPFPSGPTCCADGFIATWTHRPFEMYMIDFMAHEFQYPSNDDVAIARVFPLNSHQPSGDERGLLPSHHGEVTYRGTPVGNETQGINPRIKILCLVNTSSIHHQTNAKDIKLTWGKRCTHLVFVSDEEDKSLPAIDATEDHNSWTKLKTSILYAYENYLNEVDWIMFIRDQGYVFFKNLVPLLERYNPSEKLSFGCRFKSSSFRNGYLPFDCSIILSKAAVQVYVERGLKISRCRKGVYREHEEITFSRCLQDVRIQFVDTRDSSGRFRILPYSIENFMKPDLMGEAMGDLWFMNSYYPHTFGKECCSRSLVSLGNIVSENLYLLEFFEERFQLSGGLVMG